jgi:phosphate acetyltransferase
LMVANGAGKTVEEIVDTVKTGREAFVEAGCTIAATLVNRIVPDHLANVRAQCQTLWTYSDPVFVLPEETLLAKPTMAEIIRALNGKLVFGQDALNREVHRLKVAAMQIPNFLEHLEEGSLIITPGDRADVIVGCLASIFSERYPTIAGIVLTGNLPMAPSVQKLVDGLTRWTIPIFSVETDTYETATKVNAVEAEITPDNVRKIALALGVFESNVDVTKIEEQISVARSDRMTPILFEYYLIERARAHKTG